MMKWKWSFVSAALLVLVFALPATAASETADGLFNLPEHLNSLKLDSPGSNGWGGSLASSEKPGCVFYPAEQVNIDIAVKGLADGTNVTVDLVPIGFDFAGFGGGGDPMISGQINNLVARGDSATVTATVADSMLKLRKLPMWKFGLYAVIVNAPQKGRQPVATVLRGHRPRNVDRWTSPAMYHLHWRYDAKNQLESVSRLGYMWVRTDGFPNWSGADAGQGKGFTWDKYDQLMQIYRDNGLYIISNMYGSPRWTIDDDNWKAYNYVHKEEYDATMGEFVKAAVSRYCGEDGEGPLQVIDLWNEPWEGGGISAWNSDAIRYRQLYKVLYDNAKAASKYIKVGGASSIMNTEDKFFAYDTGVDWEKYFDVLTDHYVLPTSCYGPRIAERMGIFSIETETWLGYTEKRFTAVIAEFCAAGQKMVNPNHPSQVFWSNSKAGLMPKPAAAAANTSLYFTAGRPFQRVVFTDHLPWLYQWGTGKDAVFLLAGDMSGLENGRSVMYDQIKARGRITISSIDGKLTAYDLYGNPYPSQGETLELPCDDTPVWLAGDDLTVEQVVEAVRNGEMTDVKPVEFVLRDFTVVPQADEMAIVEVHNVLNRPVTGAVTLNAKNLALKAATKQVSLKPGETKEVAFEFAKVAAADDNAYPLTVSFDSEAGKAELAEVVHANVIVKGSPKIDGDLSDWAGVPAVTVYGKSISAGFTERAWRPWEEFQQAKAGLAQFKLMCDANYLYVSVRERNANWKPKPRLSTRKDDEYFGDTPATKHTNKNGRWVENPPNWSAASPFTGNCLQIALNVGVSGADQGIPAPKDIPADMVSVPDTDYEYSVWGAPDGGAEIWRSYYAGGPRVHYSPRIIPLDKYDGTPAGASAVVRQDGKDVIYEIALPLADMKYLQPEDLVAGKTIKLTFRLPGSGVEFGSGRSATRSNGLTCLPRWTVSPSNSIEWGVSK